MIATGVLLLAATAALAAPSPLQHEKRQLDLVSSVLGPVQSVATDAAAAALSDVSNAASIYPALLTAIEDTTPTATPRSVEGTSSHSRLGIYGRTDSQTDATQVLSSIFSSTPTNLFENAIELIGNDFTPSELTVVADTYSTTCNSDMNVNTREPVTPVYPQKSSSDAPYSLTEAQLREVIQIPSTFTYGQKPPLVMVPGTGSTGCLTFRSNFIKLFQDVSYADPIWLNIPDFLLDDAQVNSEYVAYAINYISGISTSSSNSSSNVSVIAWSQGNLNTQWPLKYWPSTRNITSDFINISPDFHGTELAYIVCPGFPSVACTPSIIQQEYNSDYVTTLRSNGGDSAYVPTTSIYSATDEIVQPQSGADASAILGDARRVGVTDAEVQVVCNGRPAGGLYSHEGILYHPLAYALAVDALTHDGPGEISRIDLATICDEVASPGLSVADVLATEGNIPVAVAAVALYEPKVVTEPPNMAYAAS